MEDQLISFETALMARKKGWKKEDITFYLPTQALMQKWLREIHNIDVVIDTSKNTRPKAYIFSIYKDEKYQFIGSSFFAMYEDCLEDSLQQALKLIP